MQPNSSFNRTHEQCRQETGSESQDREEKWIFNDFPCSGKPGIMSIDGSREWGILLSKGMGQRRPLSDIKVQSLLTCSHQAPNPSLPIILKTILSAGPCCLLLC